jgi:D-alanyl-D-alanine carboxypeptidase
MYRVSVGASNGLRWGLLSLAAALLVLAATADPADARSRRKYRAPVISDTRYAAIVVDANTGETLHAVNPDGIRHPASLTKIMTLYLLFERLEAGRLKLDTPLKVSEDAADQAPSKLGLDPGDSIEVEDAIKALVTKSANDAAVVVAEALAGSEESFARLMTRKARALGMKHTVYKNASGLPDDDQVTTARDQALLAIAIQERFPRFYRYFATLHFTYRGQRMRNHNTLLGRVDGVDGIKTGYTRASGFNLVSSVKRGERHIAAVVMGGSTGAQRDARMRSLIESTIGKAATRRTAPKIADMPVEVPESRQKPRVAKAAPAPAPAPVAAKPSAPKPDAVAGTAGVPEPHPSPGSSDPIAPRTVKTLSYKTEATRSAALERAALPPALTIEVTPQPQAPQPGQEPSGALPLPPPADRPGAPGVQPTGPLAYAATESAPALIPEPKAVPASAAAAPVPPAAAAAPPPPPRSVAFGETRPIAPAAVVLFSPTTADRRASTFAAGEPAPPSPPMSEPVARARSGWMIQVGAFEDESGARQRLSELQEKFGNLLGKADAFTESVMKGDTRLYRARFAGLDKDGADAACRQLKRSDIACIAFRN